MAMRTAWEGFLRLSLISVPVRAYNAAVPGGGDIHFHQIHGKCGNRIHYKKVCPVHGEVSKDEIVSGYEYKKDKYVEFAKEELGSLRSEDEDSINIDAFTAPDRMDPIYASGKTFYLTPAGPAGQKPFALLRDVMTEKNRLAIGTIVLSGHDEAVLIRPANDLLTMTILYHQDQLKPASAFADEVKDSKASPQEMKLAGTLIDESTPKDFDYSRYKDEYTARVAHAIEAKLEGKPTAAPRREKAAQVINLMDALRKSLDQRRKDSSPPESSKPKRRKKTA